MLAKTSHCIAAKSDKSSRNDEKIINTGPYIEHRRHCTLSAVYPRIACGPADVRVQTLSLLVLPQQLQ